jgi:SlyX protein
MRKSDVSDVSEDRLERIETKLSFSEDLLEELNRVVVRQQAQIDRLQAQIHALTERASQSPDNVSPDPRDNVPPHY